MSDFIVNSFQMPNAVIDKLLKELTGAELKCYLYVLRKTKGWNKDEDAISVTQFMKVTGLSNRKVIDACERLVELGLLEQKIGKNNVKIYAVKDYQISGSEESSLVKKVHGGSEESSLQVVKKVHTQNNNINNTTKNNNTPLPPKGESADAEDKKSKNQKIDYQAIADAYNNINEEMGEVLPMVVKVNDERKRKIKKFLGELKSPTLACAENYFRRFFADLREFHQGKNDRGWKANFDYAIRPDVVLKVREECL